MSITRVHQFVPTWEPGAIGAHALGVHETLNESGIECTTWASEIKAGLPAIARDAAGFFGDPTRLTDCCLLYHVAVGAEMGESLLLREEPLVLNHHNVTPPEYFDPWFPAMAENLEVGASQVVKLAARAKCAIADSEFNAQHIRDAGCADVVVAPVFIELDKPCDSSLFVNLRASTDAAKWLFVGRIAPNKAPHDIVCAFAWYHRAYEPTARLWFVGGGPSDAYRTTLMRLIDRLGLSDAVELCGAVSEAELGAYYRAADVFVCLSRHEGFGVPIVEAMAHELPVVALDAAAVAATSGGAALLLDAPSPALVAGSVARIRNDEQLRAGLVQAGKRRSADFERPKVAGQWRDSMRDLLARISQ